MFDTFLENCDFNFTYFPGPTSPFIRYNSFLCVCVCACVRVCV